jgi:predicted HTH transcriptional regulator
MFDDRFEISNPGGLPMGISLEAALSGSSKIRNRVIARIFKELGYIEQFGSGLQRMKDACEKMGLEAPIFQDLGGFFKVTIYSEVIGEKKLSPMQKSFLMYLKDKGKLGTKEAAEFWGLVSRGARNHLKQLLEAGFIRRVGKSAKDPHGVYVLAQDIK